MMYLINPIQLMLLNSRILGFHIHVIRCINYINLPLYHSIYCWNCIKFRWAILKTQNKRKRKGLNFILCKDKAKCKTLWGWMFVIFLLKNCWTGLDKIRHRDRLYFSKGFFLNYKIKCSVTLGWTRNVNNIWYRHASN